jgi:hypothetical protein
MALIQASKEVEDPAEALAQMVGQATRFWASEESLHRNLYGLATIDDAAADFVRRQTADRRFHVEHVIRRLVGANRLRRGLEEKEALALLLAWTRFETYEELRAAGLSVDETERLAVEQAKALLGPGGRR